ncbi:uncharacterized protein [Solanum tuberosum]|uniref:uncharacterized protein n=1 Tax=Solanum tuberosum TaxID=4113 RepID=UPI000739FD95|nr:PREDICTED: uncharacterized protein LOC107062180 [Solanum tuberosum]
MPRTSAAAIVSVTSATMLPSLSFNPTHQLSIKLTSTNFLLWRTQFLPMIRGYGLEHHLDGSQPIPKRFLGENQLNPLYQNWARQDQIVLSWIVASVSESVLPQIVGVETSRAAWEKLISAYATKAKSIADQLVALQHPINEDDLVEYVKGGLGVSYRPFTRSIDATQIDVSIDTLYGLL